MNKPHFLQKLPPVGVAVFGVIATTAGSMLVAPSTFAANFANEVCYEDGLGGLSGQTIVCQDKEFVFEENFFTGDFTATDIAKIEILSNEFVFEVDAAPDRTINGTIDYDINILPDFVDMGYTFHSLELDTDVAGENNSYLITKDYEANNGAVGTLSSPDGNSDFTTAVKGATSISILDTFDADGLNPGGGEDALIAADNGATQKRGVPEPASILGLLAVGGLGLGLKAKKQS